MASSRMARAVLRAKIDMASGNMNMRDPVMYRILQTAHHRTGEKWCIYPMYDWAHGQSDSMNGVTHSCAPLNTKITARCTSGSWMSWVIYKPRQIEFARLNLTYTVMSKRKLSRLVEEDYVLDGMTRACPRCAGCAGGDTRRSHP